MESYKNYAVLINLGIVSSVLIFKRELEIRTSFLGWLFYPPIKIFNSHFILNLNNNKKWWKMKSNQTPNFISEWSNLKQRHLWCQATTTNSCIKLVVVVASNHQLQQPSRSQKLNNHQPQSLCRHPLPVLI